METMLAVSTIWERAPWEMAPIVFIICYVFVFALFIICLVRVSRYFRSAGSEQKLLRIEIGKIADEVHRIREKLEIPQKS